MKMPEFNSKVLNIFTDASITKIDSGEYISCSGAVAYTGTLDNLTIIDEVFQVNWDSTNNNGEITAILKGIELALTYRDQFESINLFSDSKICIYGLREWIKSWVQKSKGNVLIGSQNLPVANQEVIIKCINLILDNNLDIKLYHQKGHATDRNLPVAVQTFKSSNNIGNYVTNEFIRVINSNNNYVDTKSRDVLNETYMYVPHEKPIDLVSRMYDPNVDIDRYLALVNN